MNSRAFAKAWLEKEGLLDKDSDYDGWLGEVTLKTVEFIASQGHSGASGPLMIELLRMIYAVYQTEDHPIWQAYWESDEGKKLKALYAS
jgi:hypothetical protein